MLNMVRNGRDLRCGAMRARAGWYCGARMNVKGMRAMGIAVCGSGAVKRQPSDWRRSADPEDEVCARLPCCCIFFCVDKDGYSRY